MRTSLFDETMPEFPTDAEVEDITRYTAGLMTVAEARQFEDRLTNDIAFFYRTAPMLKVWYARKPTAREAELLRGVDVPDAVEPPRAAPAPSVWTPRWRRIVTAGTIAIAAEVLVFAQIGTEVAPELVRMVAHAPVKHDSLPGPLSPPPRPATVVVRPKAPTPAAPTVIASVDSMQAPRAVSVDSATARIVAALDSAQAAAEFIASARVVDTVEAVGVHAATKQGVAILDTGSTTVLGISRSNGSNTGAPANQSDGFVGIIKWLWAHIRGGKS